MAATRQTTPNRANPARIEVISAAMLSECLRTFSSFVAELADVVIETNFVVLSR